MEDISYDIDVKWPSATLVDLFGFRAKSRNRIIDYLSDNKIVSLSLREIMDLFLPKVSNVYENEVKLYGSIPILKQPQMGPYLYDSALLTITEAELGSAFRHEWMLRIYALKALELKNRPANKRFQQTAKSGDC